MADLAVNLYEKNYLKDVDVKIKDSSIKIKRILSPNSDRLVEFVAKHFSIGWTSEVKAGVYKERPTCFVAVKDEQINGFACYDATAKGYFGPTGVDENYRGLNIGQILFLTTLEAMKEAGYGYAIIGGVSEHVTNFYARHVNVVKLESTPNLYSRLLNR